MRHRFKACSPPVHHLLSLLQVFRPVIGRPDLVSLRVGQLTLDDIRPETALIENSARQRSETMHGCSLMVAEPVEGVKEGIFRDGLFLVSLTREE